MNKRYGSGSMKEVSPGKWHLRVYLGRDPVSGQPRQRHKTFHGGEKAAGREMARLVTETQGTVGRVNGTNATLGQLLDEWIKAIKPTRATSTIDSYTRKIEHAIRPALGDIKLSKLTAHDVDRFYAEQMDTGLSSTTVRGYHAILSAALRQAVKWEWIDVAPTERATPPVARKVDLKVPTPAEVRELIDLAEAKGDPLLASAIALAALTGMRRGELCALRWSDIDLTNQVMTIARSVSTIDGGTKVGPTKTHQVRRILLDDLAVSVLRHRAIEQVTLSNRAGNPLVADPYVLSFRADGSDHVGPNTLTYRFSALCGSKWRFHDLRHFSVTTMIAAGIDVRTVADRHGHAQVSMTLDRYSHALPERDRAGANVLGDALRPQLPAAG